MKICYIANIRLPTEKAHGIQIMKTCEALTELGHEVTLIIPRRDNPLKGDIFDYYSIKTRFPVIAIPSLNILVLGRIGYWIQTLLFSEMAVWKIWKIRPDVIYARDPIILINLILVFKNIFFEAHRGDSGFVTRILLKKARLLAITHGLQNFYSPFIKNTDRSIVVPDAVDVEKFSINMSKSECRIKLGLPLDKKIALYAGHLYEWKGAQFLAEASKKFDNNELAVFVGGTENDIRLFKIINKDNQNMMIVGHKSHSDIPYYLASADVLVLPNSGKEAISRLYTSPMKLFEYMASGRPIVASELPSLCEVLDPETAVLVKPDDADALYQGIKKVFDDESLGSRISDNARKKVSTMTWVNRAMAITIFIKKSLTRKL